MDFTRFIRTFRLIKDTVVSVWRNNAAFIFSMFLLNMLIGAVYTVSFEAFTFVRIKLPILVVSVFFLSYVLGAISELFKKPFLRLSWMSFCIVLSIVLFLTESFMLYRFGTIINATTLQILMETNRREASEFMSSFFSFRMLFVVVVCMSLYLLLITRRSVATLLKKMFSGRVGGGFLLLILCLGFLGFFYGEYRYHAHGIISYRIISPAQRLYMSYDVVRKDFTAYRQLKDNIGVKDPIITADSSKINNVVLVIGESLNRNHMGVYGYDLPTTPKLSELANTDNMVVFSDVVSPSTGTIDVIQRLLTFYNYEKPGKWYDYDILIDVMRKAGYKTFWISNQESFGTSGNLSAALSTRCDYSAFCDFRNSNQEAYGDFDEHIFPLLDSLKRESSEKNLFIIHLMGSHVRYLNRYPKDFEKFSSRDEDIPYADYKKRIRSEYDNSVLYNDSIVGAIVSRFVTDETLLIYLSDHAEEVYDIRDYNGRSMENLSRQMVEIPFMIWMSDSFIENFPYKKDLIKASSTRPYMTDDVIHTILDITDISTNDYEPRRSVISPDFNADRVRRIGDKDYDTL